MNEEILKEILSFRYNAQCAHLFTEVSPSLISDIKSFSKNGDDFITLELSTEELNKKEIEALSSSIEDKDRGRIVKNLLYENLVDSLLLKQIYNRFPDLRVFKKITPDKILGAINESSKTKLEDLKLDDLIFDVYLYGTIRELNENGINVALNIYITKKNNNALQSVLNSFLDDRNSIKSRFFTEEKELLNYYTTNGILQQAVHDYHETNLKGIRFNAKQK